MSDMTEMLEVCHEDEVKEYPLTKPVMHIGRRRDRDIVLMTTHVSQYHARLEWQQGTLVIIDEGSANGTWLNDKKLEPNKPYPLIVGDSVLIGKFTLRPHTL